MSHTSFFFGNVVAVSLALWQPNNTYPSIGLPIPATPASAITASAFWSSPSPHSIKMHTRPRHRRASSIFSPLRPDPHFRPLALDSHSYALPCGSDVPLARIHATALAFSLARVFAHLTAELRISMPTPNTALGQRTLWLVAHKGTGRDRARATGTTGRACSTRNKLYFDASQQRQSKNRPSLIPSTVICHSTTTTRRGTGSTHPVYRYIAVWKNDYGTGNRQYIDNSFRVALASISHSPALRFRCHALGLACAIRVESRISILMLGRPRRRLPARMPLQKPPATALVARSIYHTREESAQRLERAWPNSSAMGSG
ncbi:hypothetical protein B0H13DRAFT_2581045 [Mycena leptocephala]|nr:hypothetical protein B0H13DRAFT_2581045 [Mycena leptocephala]